jgi:hypothetical protein
MNGFICYHPSSKQKNFPQVDQMVSVMHFQTDQKILPQVDQMVMHFQMDASILKKDSPEELAQQEILKRKKEEQERRDAGETVDVEIME